jgi:hypothetical protein
MTKMIPEHSNELVEYLAVIDKTVKFEEELDALGKLSNLVYFSLNTLYYWVTSHIQPFFL